MLDIRDDRKRYADIELDWEGEGGEPPLGSAILYAGISIWGLHEMAQIRKKFALFSLNTHVISKQRVMEK